MRLPTLLLLALSLAGAETTFEAKWKKAVRPDVGGTLGIHEDGITFQPEKETKRVLEWSFEDVQHFDRTGPTEVAIQSYSDSISRLGRDRWYRFVLVDGTFPDELHARVVDRIGRPATDRVVREPADAEVAIPAKNVRLLRGSEGMLYFTPEWVIYSTERRGHSRAWRLDRDVEAVWSSDPYRLEVHVLGGSEAFARQTDVYRFSLKQRLDRSYYDGLRMKLHSLRNSL
ncbi:MAG: hypothetical protein OXH83_15945 [Bryobacterales bacterium]|nr:hypothetical protein [Bryobacterales bacterium]